jgi:hypothetical protein
VTVPLPLLPGVGACGAACRPPLVVDDVELELVLSVVVVVVCDAALDDDFPA